MAKFPVTLALHLTRGNWITRHILKEYISFRVTEFKSNIFLLEKRGTEDKQL